MRSFSLKKWMAAFLAACMVMTNLLPVFAEPAFEMSEASEDILTAETGGITEVEEVTEISVKDEDDSEATPSDADRTKEQNAAKLLGADPVREIVTYVDEYGVEQYAECILMSGSEAVESYTFEAGEWYVVQGTFVVTGRIMTNATEGDPAHLILYSGCELQARKGIEISGGKELIIYAHDPADNESSVLTTYYENGSGTEVSEVDGNHAAIGGNNGGEVGKLTINGGKIRVRGGSWGAGIGGAFRTKAGTVTINGGLVITEGGTLGAGIGSGTYGSGPEIMINGGTVTAVGGERSAGIGCAAVCSGESTIVITGGTVTATGSYNAAGIGGGNGGANAVITINGGEVTAQGGNTAAGIGGGNGSAGEVQINGGTVKATGGGLAAGIGGGAEGSTVQINDGTVTAQGGNFGAGIGGCDHNTIKMIMINGGEVTATGGNNGAGIGGGRMAKTRPELEINGGTVTATGGSNSAGIGGGAECGGGKITINGGYVTARGQGKAAGIGGGAYVDYVSGDGADLNITGGNVEVFGGSEGVGIGGGRGEEECKSQGTTVVDETIFRILAGSSKETAVKQSLEDYLKDRAPYVRLESFRNYKVEHSLQKADGSGYDIQEEEILSGLPGTETEASAKAYPGFTAESFIQKTIADDDSTVVNINYSRNTYTIEFDKNGHGTETAPITARYGAEVSEPEAPEDPEFIFDGWCKDKECTEKFVFTTMPLNGAKIYAKWKPTVKITWMDEETVLRTDRVEIGTLPEYGENPAKAGFIFTGWTPALEIAVKDVAYTAVFWRTIEGYHAVYFDSMGGTSVHGGMVEDGKTIAKPADPVKEGYTFEGWYEDESFAKAFDFAKAILEDTTVYAKWKENAKPEYTVTWKMDTGEVIDETKVTEGEMPVHAEAEKEGYIFNGWDPALSPVIADITYKAKFIEKAKEQAAVKFDTNGGTFVDTQIVIKGETAERPEDPKKTGYEFEGWYTDNDFGTVFDFTKAIYEDTIVYAKWKESAKPQYTVTWKKDTGEVIDTTQVVQGEMPVHADAEKEGYVFIGWNPALSPVSADITYTAKFIEKKKEQSAVKFDTNGGTFVDTQIVIKGETAERPEDPKKTGYEFEGWYTDNDFGTVFDFTKAIYEDTVVYAKWKQESGKTYKILWKDYDGTVLAETVIAENRLPKYPNAKPVRSGYIFTGWDKDIVLAVSDAVYTAVYAKQTIGGGGGSSVILGKLTVPTFSPNWYSDKWGVWRIRNSAGETVANAWLCDDVIKANGKNVWYLLTQDGAMIAEGLVQDNTGNYYSLETEHNGYFGMLRYEDGYYNCGGQTVYLTFNREHNGAFGAITNADGLEKLKAIYGITRYGIGNENAVYTAKF